MTKKKTIQQRRSLPVWAWILLAAAALGLAVLAIIQLSQPTASNPSASSGLSSEVSVTDAAKMRDEGAFILDVREQSEWEQGHIPGATLIPLGDLPNRLSELPKDQNIVVVCRSGRRSAQGRDILLQAGFTQVTSMTGGMSAWQAQALPTTTGK